MADAVYHAIRKGVRDLPITVAKLQSRARREAAARIHVALCRAEGIRLMKRMLLLVAMTITTMAGPGVARAQTPTADAQTAFRFELPPAGGPRGPGVEGYVYNGLPWVITNVRLRVDSVDETGTVTDSALGWVIGNVRGGGRGYFYVPVSSRAKTYRATVQSFDKVAIDAPQAP